ncbi:MAG: hypothetical protein M3417_01170 [Actinomycetota bacterium]|nr:hypothetical protein [Actinomycetota bacterium]
MRNTSAGRVNRLAAKVERSDSGELYRRWPRPLRRMLVRRFHQAFAAADRERVIARVQERRAARHGAIEREASARQEAGAQTA